jgi:hypothetical protein
LLIDPKNIAASLLHRRNDTPEGCGSRHSITRGRQCPTPVFDTETGFKSVTIRTLASRFHPSQCMHMETSGPRSGRILPGRTGPGRADGHRLSRDVTLDSMGGAAFLCRLSWLSRRGRGRYGGSLYARSTCSWRSRARFWLGYRLPLGNDDPEIARSRTVHLRVSARKTCMVQNLA